MIFKLMNYDIELLEFTLQGGDFIGNLPIENIRYLTDSTLIDSLLRASVLVWLKSRLPFQNRIGMGTLQNVCCFKSVEDYLFRTYALSLNDALWVKSADDTVLWKDVNLYTNEFNHDVFKVFFYDNVKDRTPIVNQSIISPEFSTGGFYKKFWIKDLSGVYLYKTDSLLEYGVFSEQFTTQVAKALELQSFVAYDIVRRQGDTFTDCKVYPVEDRELSSSGQDALQGIRASLRAKGSREKVRKQSQLVRDTYSRCELFTTEHTGFKTLLQMGYFKTFEEELEHMKFMDYFDKYCEMLVLDAITLNVDRDCKNFGYLIDNSTGAVVDFAPIFDNGMTFLSDVMTSVLDYTVETQEFMVQCADSIFSRSRGNRYEIMSHHCLTDSLRTRLKNLKDFKLENIDGFNEDRLRILNVVLQRQIRKLLGE